ncbi:MAG: GNAT family N-acetyltransferase [Candidatus Omnitrophica bacterium]|nr:GNAT family N-acetyltransferase [Candidatus Omnitrophota bacterium]
MTHNLRPFENKDASGVKKLILEILEREYPFDRAAYSDSDLEKIPEVYCGRKNAFFVIEDNGKIVGTVGVKEDSKDDALLRRLFVDQNYRRRGYGSELVKRAIDFCKSQKYRRISFRCTDRMSDAMKLCVKNGFKESENLPVGGFHIHKLELWL